MAATTTRPEAANRSAATADPLLNALGGAASVLWAMAAMAAASALALILLDAGSAGSLVSMTIAATAMAVGGSMTAGSGSESAGSGLQAMMSPSMDGTADAMPLGVTLIGAVVLWFTFSRPMRHRRFGGDDLAGRLTGAGLTALIVFLIMAGFAHGTFRVPDAVMGGAGGSGASGAGASGSGNPLAAMLGGGQGTPDPTMAYRVSPGTTAFGAVLWVVVVVAVGCAVTRRARLPRGFAVSRLRMAWRPSISAVVRMFLALSVVPLAAVVIIGVSVGGSASTVAGAALLLVPNALSVVLTLGLGGSWTASTKQVQSQGDNPLASLMGQAGGARSSGAADRVEHLREVSAGGWPLWLGALILVGVALLACGYGAARATTPEKTRRPRRGGHDRHLAVAVRLAIVTAVVMCTAGLFAQGSGHFGVSVFGNEMGGMRAELSGGVLLPGVLGLFAGAAAGFTGSLLYGVVSDRSAYARA